MPKKKSHKFSKNFKENLYPLFKIEVLWQK